MLMSNERLEGKWITRILFRCPTGRVVAAERLILGLVWKLGNPSKNKRAMGFYAKSKWIEERYHLSKNTISRAYTSLTDKGFIQKAGDGSWMLNYAAVYPAAIENGWEPKKS